MKFKTIFQRSCMQKSLSINYLEKKLFFYVCCGLRFAAQGKCRMTNLMCWCLYKPIEMVAI